MKRTTRIFAALILTISLCAGATAQTSPSSTQEPDSPAASNSPLTTDQTVALLIADQKQLRKLYDATKIERDAAVAALEVEKKNSASLERSYKAAESQIETLNLALDRYEKAMALYDRTIALVEKQRDDAKKEAKRSRKVAIVSALIAAAKIFGVF
jgi:hypothetical protein